MDPMCGSGLVLREAGLRGHEAIGFDVDPLAILMSRVWTQAIDTSELLQRSDAIIEKARTIRQSDVALPWIDEDEETQKYIKFWFGNRQIGELRKLAYLVAGKRSPVNDALKIAISRTIITKKVGASLAWDVSHSRPHRVKDHNEYDVFGGFRTAVIRIADVLSVVPSGNVAVRLGDARSLACIHDEYADAVVTSPPYFNAIDYLRGHRLSLVWLGHSVSRLRQIRSLTLGRARQLSEQRFIDVGLNGLDLPDGPDDVTLSHLRRYLSDMFSVVVEIHRILKPMGRAVLVVGSSNIRGQVIDSPALISAICEYSGLREVKSVERDIPSNRRYLPPPTLEVHEALKKRMRSETVLTLEKHGAPSGVRSADYFHLHSQLPSTKNGAEGIRN